MDVPFISSGALSSAHYALIRNVESAQTIQEADYYLLSEVTAVRKRLSRPGISTKQCKECLVVLLYCFTTVTSALTIEEMEFALPHAVTLAEAGSSVSERRIGYLFCMTIMTAEHEFRLMLVNTLRKDLDAPDVGRMSLALDYLIQCPSQDVIPAIQSRLHNLLSHPSPIIRRKTIYAIRVLAAVDSSILRWLSQDISKRVRDADTSVAGAAVTACTILYENYLLRDESLSSIRKALTHFAKSMSASPAARLVVQKILRLYRSIAPSQDILLAVISFMKRLPPRQRSTVLLHECYNILSKISLDLLTSLDKADIDVLTTPIRSVLTSNDPNEQYFFLSCLGCLDPILWAGTSPDRPAVLEGWEVERIMQLLTSPDPAIRIKTMRILTKVDATIVSAYFAQTLEELSKPSSANLEDGMLLLLELGDVMAGADGEQYAQLVRQILSVSIGDPGQTLQQPVTEVAIDRILTRLRDGDETFGSNAATVLLSPIVDSDDQLNPTLMVVLTALACEYVGRVPVSPQQILQGLSKKLPLYPPSIQDAILLSMMRLAAECDTVPADVLSTVQKVGEAAGRHIQRRCDQFIMATKDPAHLKRIVSTMRSRALPDFLAALQATHTPAPSSPPTPKTNPTSPARSHKSLAGSSKLRYEAYDAPPSTSRLRRPHGSSSTRSVSRDDVRPGSALSGRSVERDLSRTVTAGELALVAGSPELRAVTSGGKHSTLPRSPNPEPVDLLGTRMDLINLDSPFITDPDHQQSSLSTISTAPSEDSARPSFAQTWDEFQTLSARGWCELPLDAAVRRLQTVQGTKCLAVYPADEEPFLGETKVVLGSINEGGAGRAAVRMKEGEEGDGCLWRLRGDEEAMFRGVKRVLADG